MRISALIMGVFILGFVIIGYYGVVAGLATEEGGYDVTVDDTYKQPFDNVESEADELSASYNKMMNFSAKTGLAYLNLVPEALIVIKNTIDVPKAMIDVIINDMVTILHLPSWMDSFFKAVLVLAIVFGFIAIVLRYRWT